MVEEFDLETCTMSELTGEFAPEPARILIVDDNASSRMKLSKAVSNLGHRPEAVDDGAKGIERLRAGGIDLLLLDIEMPVMDGFAVLERLKADPKLREVPTLVISGVNAVEETARAIELGAVDFLPKTFNAALLRARVNSCLDRKRLRDQESIYLKQIEVEKKRADDLLHATLPAAAVHELKTTNAVRPRRFDDVAVLFCDVVDFTSDCDRHPPEEVIAHLQEFVRAAEEISVRNGLEKIKTIGDAFMATGGLLQYIEDPAITGVRTGLEIVEAVRGLASGWQVRVGIHMGPVVGGVIGKRNYSFDIWGDTVNIASRIVDEASPGSVLVSSMVWRNLRDSFHGKSMGMVDLKGKGGLELIECS
jgi:class 3 adenylate cyclase/CheY-like chemotaxis protein